MTYQTVSDIIAERDSLQARVAELEKANDQLFAHGKEMYNDLAAARALLLSAAELLDEVQSYTSHAAHSPSMTRDCAAAVASIRAALAGKDAT
jgi:multidrug resistance efflux pump